MSIANALLDKSRTIAVRLISMAMTGYFRTYVRPRTHRPLSFLKYDPVGTLQLTGSRQCILICILTREPSPQEGPFPGAKARWKAMTSLTPRTEEGLWWCACIVTAFKMS